MAPGAVCVCLVLGPPELGLPAGHCPARSPALTWLRGGGVGGAAGREEGSPE